MKFKVNLPQPEVVEDEYGGITLYFANGYKATVEGEEGDKDRCIIDWTCQKGYGYMRGVQDNLHTNQDYIKYLYDIWVDDMTSRMYGAQEHLNFMYKYAVKPTEGTTQ